MEIKEIHLMSEKSKWYEQFRRAYSGGCVKKLSPIAYNEHFSRFFIATENGKEMGYARIISAEYMGPEFEGVWELSETYVKPPYRGNGVLRDLLIHSIDFYKVKMVNLTRARYFNNLLYYTSLGFTGFIQDNEYPTDDGLGYACFEEAFNIFETSNSFQVFKV